MRRARNDGRRSASPGATGPGWYRADEREMPRRPPRHLDSGPRPRPSLRLPHAPQVAWLHRSRYPDAGAWHRCKHGGLFCGEWRFASPAGLPGVKPALPHTSCCLPDVQVLSADPANLPGYQIWRKQCHSFEDIAIAEGATADLTGSGEPKEIHGVRGKPQLVSGSAVCLLFSRRSFYLKESPVFKRVPEASNRPRVVAKTEPQKSFRLATGSGSN